MSRFINKNVLIIGATSGIGKAGALRIIKEGGRIIGTGTNHKHIEQLTNIIPNTSFVYNSDISNHTEIYNLVDRISKMDKLDGVWFNAGIAALDTIDNINLDTFDRMFSVNVSGPRLLISKLLPMLNNGASIVVTSSSSVYEGSPLTSEYAATKAALISMVRSWASALADRNIRVNSIVPGPIDTNFRSFLSKKTQIEFENFVLKQVPLKRIGTADEAASVALFLLSDEASYVTGSQYAVDGGLIMY